MVDVFTVGMILLDWNPEKMKRLIRSGLRGPPGGLARKSERCSSALRYRLAAGFLPAGAGPIGGNSGIRNLRR